jgi:hypothetical protein
VNCATAIFHATADRPFVMLDTTSWQRIGAAAQ